MNLRTLATFLVAMVAGCSEGTPGLTNEAGSVARGAAIYERECAACHGSEAEGAGGASLGLGVAAPDLSGLTARNDGYFPREFVRRFVLGTLEKDDPDAAMPEFGKTGLHHVTPERVLDQDALARDLEDLLDFLATVQR